MAKLNKQEVNAVASKLHRELTKVAETLREQAMKDYVPSETYSTVKALMERRDDLNERFNLIQKEIEEVRNKINDVSSFYVRSYETKEEILDRILRMECKLSEVPSIEELKDEVTIAAIDDGFDTASYIEGQIAKFND